MGSPEFFEAIRQGEAEKVRELLKHNPELGETPDANGLSPVMFARYFEQEDVLRVLMQDGVPLNLHEAAAVGNAQRVSLLLLADQSEINAFSPDGFTALQLASYFGEPEAAEVLLDRGADVGEVSVNQMRLTALHSACAGADDAGAVRVAEILLDAGADANAVQHGGFTPLHAAAQNGNDALVRLLIARGADRAAVTDEGKTARDLARDAGHTATTALL